jgi:hypothetical protein
MPNVNFRAAALSLGILMSALAPAAHADLIGLYTYDDARNLGKDSSGKGNDLVAGWSTPTGVAGKFGGGMDLNGSAALVSPNGHVNGLPTGSSSYTIASWINPDTAGGNGAGGIVGWGYYGYQDLVVALRMNGDTQLHNYWWANDLTGNAGTDLTAGAGSNGWHFVAATFDASTNRNAIYVDGAEVASRYGYGLNSYNVNFAIGKTVNAEFFDGQMDNTAIFNQALSLRQLGKIAANDFSEFGVAANVPEPESLLLISLGFAGLLAARRQRKQR